ncbi:MAG: hypothetical protein AAFX79_04095 [Planctomycetota bacterium]
MDRVLWIFSLPRSGSSVTAYAAAHALGCPVADEPLGPWDRTGEPYHYPAEQADLVKAHLADRCMLEEVQTITLAQRVLEQIAGQSSTLVVKHPHLRPPPANFQAAFPTHRAVYLARNPLTRLNSLYARGWTDALRPNYELDHYKQFAEYWGDSPGHLTFELLRKKPRRFFRELFAAWGITDGRRLAARAADYAANHYHASSLVQEERAPAAAPSERERSLPEEAVRMYLADPEIRRLMKANKWTRRANAYLPKSRVNA